MTHLWCHSRHGRHIVSSLYKVLKIQLKPQVAQPGVDDIGFLQK